MGHSCNSQQIIHEKLRIMNGKQKACSPRPDDNITLLVYTHATCFTVPVIWYCRNTNTILKTCSSFSSAVSRCTSANKDSVTSTLVTISGSFLYYDFVLPSKNYNEITVAKTFHKNTCNVMHQVGQLKQRKHKMLQEM